MTEKEAQGNPAQPAGWAVTPGSDPDAYPAGELLALEEQKREDTAEWIDSQNRSPIDAENPAQPGGWAVPAPSGGPVRAAVENNREFVARVFVDRSARTHVGAKVLAGFSAEDHQIGEVVALKGDKMWVAWRDGEDSVEPTNSYELIIREDGE